MAQRLNLVTGACGFSGSHLVKHLLDSGQRVIATDLPTAFETERNKSILAHLGLDLHHDNLTVLHSDLTQPETLAKIFEHPITHVFHTASLYDYSASIEKLTKANVEGFENLLSAMESCKLERFIHWSTCGVFGHPYRLSQKGKGNIPFTENSSSPKTEPFGTEHPKGTYIVNDYSVTKWKQEQIAWRACREKGLPLTVIRPAPMYGRGSDYGHGGIILAIQRGYLRVIPRDARNFITTSVNVVDVARFAHFISQRDDAIGQDFNVVDDSIISYSSFLKYIALLVGRRMREVPFVRLSKPFITCALGMAKAWRWLERRWEVPRVRVFEVGSVVYIGSSYWISNAKTKDWGFTYRYPDVREGLRDTIQSFRELGWI
jgi:dihydroflavonol-4-reductase